MDIVKDLAQLKTWFFFIYKYYHGIQIHVWLFGLIYILICSSNKLKTMYFGHFRHLGLGLPVDTFASSSGACLIPLPVFPLKRTSLSWPLGWEISVLFKKSKLVRLKEMPQFKNWLYGYWNSCNYGLLPAFQKRPAIQNGPMCPSRFLKIYPVGGRRAVDRSKGWQRLQSAN